MTRRTTIATFRRHGGLLHTSAALRLGVHPRDLYGLRDDGTIEAVSRGVYRLSSGAPLGHPDLVTVAARAPRSIVCLISALAYHGLTSEVPHAVWIALPRGTKTPKIDHPPIRVVRVSKELVSLGVEVKKLGPISVNIYGVARTIADCFKFRNKIGVDVAVEGLRLCLEKRTARPVDILHFARRLRVERVMRPYLEALQ